MPTGELQAKADRIGEAIIRAGFHAIDGDFDRLASYCHRAATLWYALAPRERRSLTESDPTFLDAPDGTGEYREDAFAAWVAWRCAEACRKSVATQAPLAVPSSIDR